MQNKDLLLKSSLSVEKSLFIPSKPSIEKWNSWASIGLKCTENTNTATIDDTFEEIIAITNKNSLTKTSKEKRKDIVSKTFRNIKDMISFRLKREQSSGSIDRLNNEKHIGQPTVKSVIPSTEKSAKGVAHGEYNNESYLEPKSNRIVKHNPKQRQLLQNRHFQSEYQKAASHPHLNTAFERQSFILDLDVKQGYSRYDDVEATDSDDGGFIDKFKLHNRSHTQKSKINVSNSAQESDEDHDISDSKIIFKTPQTERKSNLNQPEKMQGIQTAERKYDNFEKSYTDLPSRQSFIQQFDNTITTKFEPKMEAEWVSCL